MLLIFMLDIQYALTKYFQQKNDLDIKFHLLKFIKLTLKAISYKSDLANCRILLFKEFFKERTSLYNII